ncbi:MAG: MFS transporter [Gaiellales bacterium]
MSERTGRTAEGASQAGWRRVAVLRPFELRDFRLLWTGLSVSLFGDGLFLVALAWQTYELSNSPSALATVGLAWTLPMVSLLLLGGVISDRFDRRRIMIASDLLRGSAVAAIGVLGVSGHIELWHLYLLSALFGVGDALFPPAFGALVPQIVPGNLLVQANSVDAFMRPLMLQLLGPAAGGLIVAAVGAAGAFLVDAGTFTVSVAALLFMRSRPLPRREAAQASMLGDIREGLRFVRSQTWLWATFAMAAVSLLFYLGPFEVLLPFVVKNEVGGSARDLGFVFAAAGVGGIVASLFTAQRRLPRRVITVMYLCFAVAVSGPIVYAVANEIWQMMLGAFVAGAGAAAGSIIWMTLMQRHVPGELLGRVTSLDWLVATCLLPISFALTGPVSAAVGVRETLFGAGVIGVALTLGFLLVPGLRDLERSGSGERATVEGPPTDG